MSPIDRNALASLVAHQLCDTQCLSAGLLSPCVLNQRCITSPGREAVGRRHGSCPVLWYAADSLDIRPTSDQHVIILYSASICRYFDDGVKSNQSAFYRTSVCCWQRDTVIVIAIKLCLSVSLSLTFCRYCSELVKSIMIRPIAA